MADLLQYGQAATIYFPIYVAGGTQFASDSDWTPGGTNTTVVRNGTVDGFASGTITYAGSYLWALPLTAAELQSKQTKVMVREPGTVDDQSANAHTYGNALAQHPNIGLAALGSVGTVDLISALAAGAISSVWNAGTKQQFEVRIYPAYNVNDDKFSVAAWLERDNAVMNATTGTIDLFAHNGTSVYANADWDTGPSEIAALNTWYVEKTTATNIKGGTAYIVKVEFTYDGTSFIRHKGFGAYGTGTGA
jgi:hypothetical protein